MTLQLGARWLWLAPHERRVEPRKSPPLTHGLLLEYSALQSWRRHPRCSLRACSWHTQVNQILGILTLKRPPGVHGTGPDQTRRVGAPRPRGMPLFVLRQATYANNELSKRQRSHAACACACAHARSCARVAPRGACIGSCIGLVFSIDLLQKNLLRLRPICLAKMRLRMRFGLFLHYFDICSLRLFCVCGLRLPSMTDIPIVKLILLNDILYYPG